jgi:Flp pilus assembly protein TadB
MALYELVGKETADPAARRAAAEALVRIGLLRRDRTGPSPMFMWLAAMTLVIVAVGSAQSLGAWAVLVFVAGAGALILFVLRRRRPRGDDQGYVGPKGETISVPRAGEPR